MYIQKNRQVTTIKELIYAVLVSSSIESSTVNKYHDDIYP